NDCVISCRMFRQMSNNLVMSDSQVTPVTPTCTFLAALPSSATGPLPAQLGVIALRVTERQGTGGGTAQGAVAVLVTNVPHKLASKEVRVFVLQLRNDVMCREMHIYKITYSV